jgi:hypothetical protein
MEIKVIRKEFENDTTMGEMFIDNKFFCYTLEDKDRGYSEHTPLSQIKEDKVIGSSAIPYGRYRVIMSYSIKLKRYLPLLLEVPLGKGIRIHNGTDIDWTHGCVLVGFKRNGKTKLFLQSAKDAEHKLVELLDKANKVEPIYITITKDGM